MADRRERASTRDGTGTLTLPFDPNEDDFLTCIYCNADHCAFALSARMPGKSSLLGLCAACRATFQDPPTSDGKPPVVCRACRVKVFGDEPHVYCSSCLSKESAEMKPLEAIALQARRYLMAVDAHEARDWEMFEAEQLGAVSVEFEKLRAALDAPPTNEARSPLMTSEEQAAIEDAAAMSRPAEGMRIPVVFGPPLKFAAHGDFDDAPPPSQATKELESLRRENSKLAALAITAKADLLSLQAAADRFLDVLSDHDCNDMGFSQELRAAEEALCRLLPSPPEGGES